MLGQAKQITMKEKGNNCQTTRHPLYWSTPHNIAPEQRRLPELHDPTQVQYRLAMQARAQDPEGPFTPEVWLWW